MKRILGLFILAIPLAFPALSVAADQHPDEAFFKDAAHAGLGEVELGTLAQEKGSSQDVKDFGAMMVKDHGAANDKLKGIASAEAIELPTGLSVGDKAQKAKLEVLSGDTFDKSYIKGQIKAHEKTLALLNKEKSTGQDAQAKAFATEVTPTVRAHLKKAKELAAALGEEPKK